MNRHALPVLLATLLACGESQPVGSVDAGDAGLPADVGASSRTPQLRLEEDTPPISVPDGTFFASAEAYGPYAANVYDVFLPESESPTPLVIYIHGGGFTGGSRESIYVSRGDDEIPQLLEAGVAYATIDYRLLEDYDTEGVLKPMGDSRRALQFFRYHADSLNVDPARVAAYGSSAGAGTALWLATHDDMAEPDAEDPVLGQSTRLVAVGAQATQASYDLVRWETDVFVDFDIRLEQVLAAGFDEATVLAFYAMSEGDSFDDADIAAYRAEVDMLGLMDGGDPPIWVNNFGSTSAPTDIGRLYHHPFHAREVLQHAQAAGIEVHAVIESLGYEESDAPTLVNFLLTVLDVD